MINSIDSEAEFTEKVLKAPESTPVLIDFFATWCGPCKILSPILDELAEEYKDKVEFYKIDVDQNKSIAESYGVMGIPSIKIFKKGEIIEELTGLQQKEVLNDILKRTLKA